MGRLSALVAEGQRNAERESKLSALHEEVSKQETKIQDLKDIIKDLERQQAEENSIAPANVATPGQDKDGLALGERRATATPVTLTTMSAPAKKGGRALLLPTPEGG